MKQQDLSFQDDNGTLTLGVYAEHAYLDYAISVVKGRALPNVCDGQKPVQRRILFAMKEMGLFADAKSVKSARVVGDVLGKFHPHGDQSAYDALVRLAQDFSMRYTLIDGQGNFGSRDGDRAAAMRYTEARLTPIASLLLDEIDSGTVNFIPNYDSSQEEPHLLPSRLPFVLLNGASGIAVGLATEIPSHNLREVAQATVALIRNPKLDDASLMNFITGPDFPRGGQLISSPADILSVYIRGRGSLKVRARWKIEKMMHGQWQIVVYELPPNTSSQKILEEVEELTNPKVKLGKKSLTTEQQNLKQSMLSILDCIRDESGKTAPVRLVFEPKSSKIDQQMFINMLLAYTSLDSSISINLVMIGTDGRPRQKTLCNILTEWISFRFSTITSRSQHRLDKVADRIHVLEGRLIIFLNIDEVIRMIRESDEPKLALMRAFELSDRQADDILEIRLRHLARLESIKLEKEVATLRQEKTKLENLLASESAINKLMIQEIEADAKQFGDERRTIIQEEKRIFAKTRLADDPVTIVISSKGWIRILKGHGVDTQSFSFKIGDSLYNSFECRTLDWLMAFDSNGRVYSLAISSLLPGGRGDGVPMTSLIQLQSDSRLLHYFAGSLDHVLLLSTTAGFGFIAKLSDMVSRVKLGKSFISIDDNTELLPPVWIRDGASSLACLSSAGHLLIFSLDEMKRLSRGGRGVRMIDLHTGEKLIQALPISHTGVHVYGIGRDKKVKRKFLSWKSMALNIGKRGQRGHALTVGLLSPHSMTQEIQIKNFES
ncbi:DNA topoisomerase IV subunit A [Candidatus Pandoraea novymonadis]|uniref:DNA topoisomerase 4 subunit A n=1 Tax=Candidatus Pandoraea novymonadis TaxID=1808959 RepID=A0ABX5FE40_9BURK|nr:DNA topoisomerase IV subunit A [Candidatus Pandoraea novymonadis]PSB91984.1 DNA topoisomerase 4 subunit A [Candidatus Pandoraea novymonadis]